MMSDRNPDCPFKTGFLARLLKGDARNECPWWTRSGCCATAIESQDAPHPDCPKIQLRKERERGDDHA
jgi:hypothetical protein